MYTKNRIILIIAVGAYLCASCQQAATHPSPSSTPVSVATATPLPDPDIEDYAVYNDLLTSKFKGADIDQILIIDHTRVHKSKVTEKDLTEFQEYMPLAPELVTSFVERNQQSYHSSQFWILGWNTDY